MIKAVTFDFWNTIAHVPPHTMAAARRQAVAAECERCGTTVEPGRLTASLEELESHYRRCWAQGQHLHPDTAAELLVRELEIEAAARSRVAEAFLTAGQNVNLTLAPDLEPSLMALRSRGIRLGIVCDVVFSGGALLRELLDAQGLLEYFSAWGFSDEVGCYKPSPRIFEAALEGLDTQPTDALHVGDLRRTDIAGATALKMKAARYRGMHDDPDDPSKTDAEFILDSHLQVVDLVDHPS